MDVITKTVEKKYVSIDGVEIRAHVMLEFLEDIMGTDGFNALRWHYKFKKIGKVLVDRGIVSRNVRGSWYESDKEAINKLFNELNIELYGEPVDIENYR